MLVYRAIQVDYIIKILQKHEIEDEGERHDLYNDVNEEQLKTIQEDENTKSVVLSRDVGYADLAGSENKSKPYLFIKEYNEAGFNQFPIELIEGKIPTKENELRSEERRVGKERRNRRRREKEREKESKGQQRSN